ncbi:MAG: riboflavin synthase [Candidatus Gracilibacteria bacterium]
MFSGIIEQKAKILNIQNGVLTIENTFQEIPTIGQSIAHDGACMTITDADAEKYSFFAMEESLKITNFGTKKIGDFFNVERSLKMGDRIDGHFVTGHVDTVGNITEIIINNDQSKILTVHFDPKFQNFIIQKGSITINGVSLTIVDQGRNFLSVSLIHLTQEITNLGDLRMGDNVNLEFDMMGKYISKMMGHK